MVTWPDIWKQQQYLLTLSPQLTHFSDRHRTGGRSRFHRSICRRHPQSQHILPSKGARNGCWALLLPSSCRWLVGQQHSIPKMNWWCSWRYGSVTSTTALHCYHDNISLLPWQHCTVTMTTMYCYHDNIADLICHDVRFKSSSHLYMLQ